MLPEEGFSESKESQIYLGRSKKDIIEDVVEIYKERLDSDNKHKPIVETNSEETLYNHIIMRVDTSLIDEKGMKDMYGVIDEYSGSGLYTSLRKKTKGSEDITQVHIIQAPDISSAEKILEQLSIGGFPISQITAAKFKELQIQYIPLGNGKSVSSVRSDEFVQLFRTVEAAAEQSNSKNILNFQSNNEIKITVIGEELTAKLIFPQFDSEELENLVYRDISIPNRRVYHAKKLLDKIEPESLNLELKDLATLVELDIIGSTKTPEMNKYLREQICLVLGSLQEVLDLQLFTFEGDGIQFAAKDLKTHKILMEVLPEILEKLELHKSGGPSLFRIEEYQGIAVKRFLDTIAKTKETSKEVNPQL